MAWHVMGMEFFSLLGCALLLWIASGVLFALHFDFGNCRTLRNDCDAWDM
jgi:hypothetical protein